jgi:Oxidoreductase family, NAD-binding Rossmann fold
MNAAPFSDLTRPIRVGVVGAGYFSQFHLQGWARCPQAAVVAICDADFARAQAAASLHNIAGCYQDAATMLASEDIDLVDVIVPPVHQVAVLRATLAKNIPTICQKPKCHSSCTKTSVSCRGFGKPSASLKRGSLGRRTAFCFASVPVTGKAQRLTWAGSPIFAK